jgi:hypothetical protein
MHCGPILGKNPTQGQGSRNLGSGTMFKISDASVKGDAM